MTHTTDPNSPSASPRPSRWGPDYRSVWRWHFYAGLIAIPFVVLLSISGGIYLFRPQIEAWLDRPYDHLPDATPRQPPAAIVAAAVAATPGSSLNAFELPQSETDAARVLLSTPGGVQRVYLHPRTLAVLASVDEQDRFMRWIFRLHGELLIGNPGSYVVEIAASWTVVLIVTGLWLWWPRGQTGLAGVLYPRLRGGRRVFWRDIHGVTAFWISGVVLLLLFSGLPWAKFWGDYFRGARAVLNIGSARQDWANGAAPRQEEADPHAQHGMTHGSSFGRRMSMQPPSTGASQKPPLDGEAMNRVVATVAALDLAAPVQVKPPGKDSHWRVASMAANRPKREELSVDADGTLLSRSGFAEKMWPDKVVAVGIAWHEGQLFGWLNQLIGLLAVLGLLLICFSAVVMWWRRRPLGVLGAPPAAAGRGGIGLLIAGIVVLGVLLPLFLASLVVVLAIEVVALRRMPVVSEWLGLTPRAG